MTGILSLLARTGEDESVEVGTVGSEGMLGVPIFLGATTAPTFAFSQVLGCSACIEVQVFQDELNRRGALHMVLQRYTQALFNRVAQDTACNRHHETRQRLARWMLQSHDRSGADTFPMTQEFMAQMLGVRRASATEAAQALQADGLISYTRGMMTITDRQGLEVAACRCYTIIVADFDALIPHNPTATGERAEPWGNHDMHGPGNTTSRTETEL